MCLCCEIRQTETFPEQGSPHLLASVEAPVDRETLRKGTTALSIQELQGQVSRFGVVHLSRVQQPQEHKRSGAGHEAQKHHKGRCAREQRALPEEPMHEEQEWRRNVHDYQAQRQHDR